MSSCGLTVQDGASSSEEWKIFPNFSVQYPGSDRHVWAGAQAEAAEQQQQAYGRMVGTVEGERDGERQRASYDLALGLCMNGVAGAVQSAVSAHQQRVSHATPVDVQCQGMSIGCKARGSALRSRTIAARFTTPDILDPAPRLHMPQGSHVLPPVASSRQSPMPRPLLYVRAVHRLRWIHRPAVVPWFLKCSGSVTASGRRFLKCV